uniref:Uncharacterized protein n=1 Tax=Peronospora matthiolae TaxID=2874970 RepID=A0AAV1V2Z8_9STRA
MMSRGSGDLGDINSVWTTMEVSGWGYVCSCKMNGGRRQCVGTWGEQEARAPSA